MININTHSPLFAELLKDDNVSTKEPEREIWEQFIETGTFPDKTPRSIIMQSWMQSRSLGIDPLAKRAKTVLSLDQIEHQIQTGQLGKASVDLLQDLLTSFKGSQHVMVLADANGHILHSVGHREIQYELDRINFMPGGNWAEKDVGPNGVGTPLTLGRPEVVLGTEHYCEGWQPWVCYGAPVYNPRNDKILGVIDITGPIEKASQETFLLTVSIAQSIQNRIKLLGYDRREKLRFQAKDFIKRWNTEALLLIDEDGYVVDYNSKSERYFNSDSSGILERPLSYLIPGIWETVHTWINKKSYGQIDVDIRNNLGINRPIQIHIEPIIYNGEPLGAILIISGQESVLPKNTNNSKLEHQTKYTFDHVRGNSENLKKTINLARAAAADNMENNVFLVGETGTGKELIAHSIHAESSRKNSPFIAVNCGALPHELIESELFGYVAGAFTGARREGKVGKFEVAQNGTLFLDEIDSLDTGLQAKFLRVLDNKQISRLGSNQVISVNVRIIAAASRQLQQKLESGQFRIDLYHRLSVIEIPIPPLSERGHDVIDLANEFLEKECWSANRSRLVISNKVKPLLLGYSWPGNVRELYNLCLRWVLTVEGDVVDVKHLPDKIRTSEAPVCPPKILANGDLKQINDDIIRNALEISGGNVSRAAKELGINRATIYRRLKKCN